MKIGIIGTGLADNGYDDMVLSFDMDFIPNVDNYISFYLENEVEVSSFRVINRTFHCDALSIEQFGVATLEVVSRY